MMILFPTRPNEYTLMTDILFARKYLPDLVIVTFQLKECDLPTSLVGNGVDFVFRTAMRSLMEGVSIFIDLNK